MVGFSFFVGTSPPPESTADLSNLVEDGTHQEEEKVH